MAVILDRRLIDELLAEHRGHPSNYANPSCRVCIFNCEHHIQRRDCDAGRAREIIKAVPLSTINDAIREVCTALGDDTLVRPVSETGGLRA